LLVAHVVLILLQLVSVKKLGTEAESDFKSSVYRPVPLTMSSVLSEGLLETLLGPGGGGDIGLFEIFELDNGVEVQLIPMWT